MEGFLQHFIRRICKSPGYLDAEVERLEYESDRKFLLHIHENGWGWFMTPMKFSISRWAWIGSIFGFVMPWRYPSPAGVWVLP